MAHVEDRCVQRVRAIRLSWVLVAVLAAADGGCGGSGNAPSASVAHARSIRNGAGPLAAVGISTSSRYGLAQVLVDGQGRTLYVFLPDRREQVTCVHACAQLWLPMKAPTAAAATVSGQVKSSLLGSDADPEGGRVLTYAGWPLYRYFSYAAAGIPVGDNGGLWHMIAPSGSVITTIRVTSSPKVRSRAAAANTAPRAASVFAG